MIVLIKNCIVHNSGRCLKQEIKGVTDFIVFDFNSTLIYKLYKLLVRRKSDLSQIIFDVVIG